MGISGLLAILEPWAERGTLRGERVVIDGPAFAYHIFAILQSHGVHRPSGKQIAQTAIKWMDHLASQDTTMFLHPKDPAETLCGFAADFDQ